MSKQQEFYDEFHAHLDKCKQCENNPFELCSVGKRLLNESVQKIKTHMIMTQDFNEIRRRLFKEDPAV